MPLIETRLIFQFGFMLREGQMAVELVRPVDMQARFFVEGHAQLLLFLVLKIPLALVEEASNRVVRQRFLDLPRIWYHWLRPTQLAREEAWIDRGG